MPVSKLRKKKHQQHAAGHGASGDLHTPVNLDSKPWLAPVMVALMVIGLLWIVTFYLAGDQIGFMQSLGNLWNVAIGFVLIGTGFAMSTRWR